MSNVIRFLEALGSNPALTRLSVADYEAVVASLDADAAQQQALLGRNHSALNDLLGGRAERMMLMQWAPEEQPFRKDDDQPDDDQPGEEPTPDSDQPQ